MSGSYKLYLFIFTLLACSCSMGISLIERSPFIGPNFSAGPAEGNIDTNPANPADYEFHGVYELGGVTHVLLKSRNDGKYKWFQVGKDNEGIFPKKYDIENNKLYLVANSKEVMLTLEELGEFKSIPVQTGPTTSRSVASQRPFVQRNSSLSLPVSTRSTSGRRPIPSRSPVGSMSRSRQSSQNPAQNRATLQVTPGTGPQQTTLISPGAKPPKGAPSFPSNVSPPPPPGG